MLSACLAVVACLALFAGITDVHRRLAPELAMAPPPPSEVARDGRVTVRVTRADGGGGVEGATVRVFWERAGRYYLAARVVTDAAGLAQTEALPRGPSWLIVDAAGYARTSSQLVVESDAREVTLALEPARNLVVRVEDEQGAAIPRATVLASTGDPLPFGALTGADGSARIDRLGAPPWTVKASALGHESVTRSGVTGDVTLTLRRLGSLEVHVVRPDGSSAPGAAVVIGGSGLWPARRAETGSDGRCHISGLVAGTYDLKATAGNMVSETLHGLVLERGEDESVTLRLVPGRMVTVLVTAGDADDAAPVVGADVVLSESGLSTFPLRGRTGQGGVVELGPVAHGLATVTASAEGFVPRAPVAVPDVLDGPVRVALIEGATLEGTVVDARDRPVDGASIEIIGIDLDGFPIAETPLSRAYRRSHFEWSLPGPLPLIPAGELGVMPGPIPPIPPEHAGFEPPPELAGAPSPFDVTEPPEPWVTRLDGTFRARPVTPGRVRALVRHPAYVEGLSEVVTLAPGGKANVKVVLLAGGSLEGKVVDASGRGVSGARVDLSAVRGTLERMTMTASDGSFAFAAVPSEVTLSVARPEDLSRIVLRKTVTVEEGGKEVVELTLPGEREAVRVVVRDDDGRAVDAAQVTVVSLEADAPLRQTAFTSAEGRVEIGDARGMQLTVVVEAPGFARFAKTFERAPEELVVELSRGVVVEGRVTAVRGRKYLQSASVTVIAEGRRASSLTDAEGRYRIRDVAPGPVRVLVSHPEHASAEVSAVVERTGRADRAFELPTVDLSEPATIEGEVVDEAGDPVSGARVAVGVAPAYLPAGALPAGMAVTDAKGRFTLRGVAPGKVFVEAYAPDVGRGGATVEVSVGRPATTRIALKRQTADDDPTVTGSVAVTLGERGADDGVEVVIVHVAAGSDAERAGLSPGDVIVAVDGARVASMKDARARLSGRPGSDVVVELSRSSATVKQRLTREHVRR